MDFMMIILSFFAGVLGTFLGGTQTFICTGLIGLIVSFFSLAGYDVQFLNDIILNVLFLPCIIFNGAGVATAYAAKNHDIRGVNTDRSLLFTKDYKVFLCGGIFGVVGYLLFTIFTSLNLPLDIGALVVVLVGIIGRLLFNQEQWINKKAFTPSRNAMVNLLTFQFILSIGVSLITILLVDLTNIVSIGFYISAFSLIFVFKYPQFPATHHISMVVGYAYVQTGDIFISLLFGVMSHLIFTVFGLFFNVDCGTHIDPPAVAIGTLSLIIFILL